MAFDYTKPMFNDTTVPDSPTVTADVNVETPTTTPVSEAVVKFRSCRWRKPAEDQTPDCCSHRDVLPITGVHGFDPEAWCLECTFFKLRRTPKKRPMDDYRY